MTQAGVGELAGTVRWAVIPYAPAPPFRLYAGIATTPIVVEDASTLVDAARRGGDAELSYIVPAKARPVLLLSEPPVAHNVEVVALRLLRLSRLERVDQEHVRSHQDSLLFHLDPDRFDLPEESAAIVSALVRLDIRALGNAPSLGRLDDREMREIGERVIHFFGFDTSALVERRIRELVALRRRRDRQG